MYTDIYICIYVCVFLEAKEKSRESATDWQDSHSTHLQNRIFTIIHNSSYCLKTLFTRDRDTCGIILSHFTYYFPLGLAVLEIKKKKNQQLSIQVSLDSIFRLEMHTINMYICIFICVCVYVHVRAYMQYGSPEMCGLKTCTRLLMIDAYSFHVRVRSIINKLIYYVERIDISIWTSLQIEIYIL